MAREESRRSKRETGDAFAPSWRPVVFVPTTASGGITHLTTNRIRTRTLIFPSRRRDGQSKWRHDLYDERSGQVGVLIYSMGVSVDGFIADREGAFGWTTPNDEQFRFHVTQTRELGGYLCGRRLYETMLVWETDPSMRDNALGTAF